MEQSIRNGEEVVDDPRTIAVVAMLRATDRGLAFHCTGSVVSPRVVLTAAHCVRGFESFSFYVNEGLITTGPDVRVVDWRTHFASPSASSFHAGVDLALLLLERPIARPAVPLAAQHTLTIGDNYASVGYGIDETDSKESGGVLRKALIRYDGFDPNLDPSERPISDFGLLRFVRGPSDAIQCPGDSGSPVLAADGALIGVLSYGNSDSCASASVTRSGSVPEHLAWLVANIRALDPTASRLPTLNAWRNNNQTAYLDKSGRLVSNNNARSVWDVNNDGFVSSIDALLVLNRLNREGGGALDRANNPNGNYFIDVNGDGFVSPVDALLVINELNRVSARRHESSRVEDGDLTMDAVIDSSDVSTAFQHCGAYYETGRRLPRNLTFCDLNRDGLFGTGDLVVLCRNGACS